MLYGGSVSYNEEYFRYDGVRIVEPETFGPTGLVTNLRILKVVILSPDSIDSTIVFVPLRKISVFTGTENVSESTGYVSLETYGSGILDFSKLDDQTFAIGSAESELTDPEAYIAFSVSGQESEAVAQAEMIILQSNSAGTVDVTVVPTA